MYLPVAVDNDGDYLMMKIKILQNPNRAADGQKVLSVCLTKEI